MRWMAIGWVGVCLATVTASASAQNACFPACRAGYVCYEGACVSACNPPCAAGESCTAAGECARPSPKVQPILVVPPTGGSPAQRDPAWARSGGILGIISGGVIVAGTVGVLATNGDEVAPLAIGGATTLFFAVTAPIVAAGAASARRGGFVRGLPGARIAGWIGYGATLLDALVLLGIGSQGVTVPAPVISTVGLLAVASTAAFTVDAFGSAAEAEDGAADAKNDEGWSVAPIVAATPYGGVVGLGGSF